MRMLLTFYCWVISLAVLLVGGILLPLLWNGEDATIGIILALIIWGIVFRKTFALFLINVGNNEGVVLFDPFFKEQTEIGSGWRFKFVWESTYARVDLRKEIITMEHKAGESYATNNGSKVEVKWIMVLAPKRGFLVNYVAFKKGDKAGLEDDAAQQFRARVSAFLNGYIKTKSAKELIGGKTQKHSQGFSEIHSKFEFIFGGQDIMDPLEIMYGVWSGIPDISDIDLDEASQKAANTSNDSKTLIDASVETFRRLKRLDPTANMTLRECIELSQVERKSKTAQIIEYKGLDKLPPGTKHVVLGGQKI